MILRNQRVLIQITRGIMFIFQKEEEYLRKIGLVLLDIRDMLEKQPVSDVADSSKEKLSFLMNRRV